ncbi:Ent-kaurene oxidase [Talaromyces islandicus]|uniref:Ent-kaurene oxidase n=1 Tax=Talaromyces islandicus TaxID=28573 RepID=A0A0U1LWW4_TALIS|nr:Ent-kaurene oxidase [Talaromyces islandicus]
MDYLLLASPQGFLFVFFILVFVVFKSWKIATSSSEEIEKSFLIPGISGKIQNIAAVLRFFVSGPSIIMDGYANNKNAPYVVQTQGKDLVIVSSDSHIKELLEAPETQLSLHAVAKDLFKPKYTMYEFDVHDEMAANGSMHFRVLRTLLTANLPRMLPELHSMMQREFASEVLQGYTKVDEWSRIPTFDVAKRLVARINSYLFVGKDLTENPVYLEAALAYPQEVFVTGEILQLTPEFLAPLVTSIATKQGKALKTMLRYLFPIVEERLRQREKGLLPSQRPLDCLQWIIDSSPTKEKWDAKKVVQETLALWFGSVHQLSMAFVYALYDLVDNPSYITLLRDELASAPDGWLSSLNNLPLLDSFLKESTRLSPSDSISLRRKALKTFKFSDGTVVPKGAWVCVPQRAVQRDAAYYENPEQFDGHRFVNQGSALTDLDARFPFWGLGKRACPGRFYAVGILKMMVASVIEQYDIDIDHTTSPEDRMFWWRSAIIPKSTIELRVHSRQ